MNCLRCGKEIQESEVFCAGCLAEMEKHPVSRETAAIILPRPVAGEMRRRPVKPEELLAKSRRQFRRLLAVAFALLLICIALAIALFLSKQNADRPIGQNYITNTDEGTGHTS